MQDAGNLLGKVHSSPYYSRKIKLETFQEAVTVEKSPAIVQGKGSTSGQTDRHTKTFCQKPLKDTESDLISLASTITIISLTCMKVQTAFKKYLFLFALTSF